MPVFPAQATQYPVSYLMGRTFDLLLGAARQERNYLAASVGVGDATLTVSDPAAGLQRGTFCAIDDEVLYVRNATQTSTSATITVVRGEKGTIASMHSSGATVYVNPFFTRYEVRRTLQDEIRSWAPQVFGVKAKTLNTADFVNGYDLGALGQWIGILQVYVSPDVASGMSSDKSWPTVPYRVERNANVTDFPSGNALIVTAPLWDNPRTLQVLYASEFDVDTSFSDSTDLIAQVGLDSHLLDIAPYGAAWRLISGWEIKRLAFQAQGQESDKVGVQAGATVQSAEQFKKLRDSRLNDAIIWLRSQYPNMRR